MGFYEIVKRSVGRVADYISKGLGEPSSLLKLTPEKIKDFFLINNERYQEALRKVDWYKKGAEESIEYLGGREEEMLKAIRRRSERISFLERQLNEKDKELGESEKQVRTAEAEAIELQRHLEVQRNGATHWKRAVVEAHHNLLQSHARYQSRRPREFVIVVDSRDKITYASPKSQRLLGADIKVTEKREVYSFILQADGRNPAQIKYALNEKIRNGGNEPVPLPRVKIAGKGRNSVEMNLVVEPLYSGEAYVGSVVREETRAEYRTRATEEKNAQVAREHSEKLASDEETRGAKDLMERELALIREIFEKRKSIQDSS